MRLDALGNGPALYVGCLRTYLGTEPIEDSFMLGPHLDMRFHFLKIVLGYNKDWLFVRCIWQHSARLALPSSGENSGGQWW